MMIANLGNSSSQPLFSTEPQPNLRSALKPVFIGTQGLRSGWRLLLYLTIFGMLIGSFVLVSNGGVEGVRKAQQQLARATITPSMIGQGDTIAFLFLCLAALIMSRIEHRKFSDYGLPLRQALRKDFWIGCGAGFAAISGTLLAIFLLHGFRITGLALHGTAILTSSAAWALAFLAAGLFEEFLFRGYLQCTLASGIGFGPAAFVMSGLFALLHIFNPGETPVGALSTGIFGLLFCLILWRTGNIWLPVGFHLAWDWGQSFYGVPDSGIQPWHNVFNSTLSGPQWLTGGAVGPEASIFTPIALLVVALLFNRYYRNHQSPVEKPASVSAAA